MTAAHVDKLDSAGIQVRSPLKLLTLKSDLFCVVAIATAQTHRQIDSFPYFSLDLSRLCWFSIRYKFGYSVAKKYILHFHLRRTKLNQLEEPIR